MLCCLFTMKHDKWKVFFPAVCTMMGLHLMSVGLGNIFPYLFSKNFIVYFSVILFLFFGVLMIYEAYHLQPRKSEEKLAELNEGIMAGSTSENAGTTQAATALSPTKELAMENTKKEEEKMFCKNPYMHLVVLLFLADWGDRCQISAIVLTATYNVWGVAFGGAIVIFYLLFI